MKTRTLRGQLSRASTLTTLFALLVSAAALLLYETLNYRRGWVGDLQTQADLVAHASAAALVFNDPRAAQQYLALMKQQPRIRAAAVYRAAPPGSPQADALFAAYSADSADPPAPAPAAGLLAAGHRFDGSRLELVHPVEHDGERVGTVYLRARHDVWARMGSYAAILGAVAAASLGLAFMLFGRLLRQITRPLVSMTQVAQQVMERRDWSLRAPDTPTRDLSLLVKAFNGVLAECGARTGELEREMIVRQNAEAELRQADRRKDEFLATLAHELRNPLAPIANAAALLRMPQAEPAVREMANTILDRQLRQMVRLIDDLLDVSRLATGKLSLHIEPIDLVAVLRAAVELAEPGARQHQLALVAELPARACPMLGDAARLSQVFSNLLNNACRYTPAGGRIEVGLQAGEGTVQITVRDSGIGIEPAMQQRIFELFEQADKRLERGNAGLGIGLTLARQLVQLHGGELTVDSAGLGQGSTFRVSLPLKPAQEPVPPAEPAQPERPDTRLRVLLADDNVDFTASLQKWLQSRGHEVTVVHDGHAALAAAAADRPDVAILDIGMPGLNGYDVARRLRARPDTASLMLVAATGWGQPTDKQAAASAGFDHHVVKPVAPDELLAILASGAAPRA